jgi:HTH-type transcriptional regulator / antitoxin HigA
MEGATLMATTTHNRRRFRGPPANSYAGLVSALPPRPLRDKRDYNAAVEMIGRLVGYKLNRDQEDYLEALTVFVERYEVEHEETQVDTRHVSGLKVLQSLMDEHKMNGADLSRLLGASRTLGPMILRGERGLTIPHARLLGRHFHVDPGVFIR